LSLLTVKLGLDTWQGIKAEKATQKYRLVLQPAGTLC